MNLSSFKIFQTDSWYGCDAHQRKEALSVLAAIRSAFFPSKQPDLNLFCGIKSRNISNMVYFQSLSDYYCHPVVTSKEERAVSDSVVWRKTSKSKNRVLFQSFLSIQNEFQQFGTTVEKKFFFLCFRKVWSSTMMQMETLSSSRRPKSGCLFNTQLRYKKMMLDKQYNFPLLLLRLWLRPFDSSCVPKILFVLKFARDRIL